MKLTEEHEQLLAEFRALPEKQKERVLNKATKLQTEALERFATALFKMPKFSTKAKLKTYEAFFGPVDQSEDDAVQDGSRFSRMHDLSLMVSIVIVMKKKQNEKERRKNKNNNRTI